jgi:HNH endonuclease/NUMOD4 motif/AP2 domain
MEIYKNIPGYEESYQVSNQGNVKSLKGKLPKILTPICNKRGYMQVSLCQKNVKKVYTVHQLIAIAFLNFVPDGHKMVINHINIDRTDNRLENLEIVTNRENCNMQHIKSSSKYTGVSFRKDRNKWAAEIKINGKRLKLGHYSFQVDAHLAYQIALNAHLKGDI